MFLRQDEATEQSKHRESAFQLTHLWVLKSFNRGRIKAIIFVLLAIGNASLLLSNRTHFIVINHLALSEIEHVLVNLVGVSLVRRVSCQGAILSFVHRHLILASVVLLMLQEFLVEPVLSCLPPERDVPYAHLFKEIGQNAINYHIDKYFISKVSWNSNQLYIKQNNEYKI